MCNTESFALRMILYLMFILKLFLDLAAGKYFTNSIVSRLVDYDVLVLILSNEEMRVNIP